MESARDIVDKIRELECGWLYELPYDEAAALIEADRAAIRKECADRAVKWAKKWAEFPMGNHGEGALRAEIMGDQEKNDD